MMPNWPPGILMVQGLIACHSLSGANESWKDVDMVAPFQIGVESPAVIGVTGEALPAKSAALQASLASSGSPAEDRSPDLRSRHSSL